ncbi:MAG: ABC transporter permease, partial [Anaerovoracaceae bacterium]
NLGVEGMMLMGAVIGFKTGMDSGSPVLAMACAFIAGAGGAAMFAFITVSLRANQVVTGLALTIFGAGFAGIVGKKMVGSTLPSTFRDTFSNIPIPILSDIPVIGKGFFNHDIMVYIGYVLVAIIFIYYKKTKIGLNARAVGENTAAADASGINVDLYKYINIIVGGGLCGIGGAYMAIVYISIWQEGIVAGRGWIAVALVIFASWRPIKAFIGALLFGGLSILGFRLQAKGINVSQFILDMVPYAATIIVVILSTHKNKKEDMPPGDLGNPYFREER